MTDPKSPAVASTTQGRGATTVTVACKLPHGLILRLFKMNETEVPVLGGGTRMEKVAEQVGDVVEIKGYAVPFGAERDFSLVGGKTGFALTPGVNKDFFDEWLRQNKDHPAVVSGLVFASPSESRAKDEAKDKRTMRNGQEPIDPDNPPQVSKRLKVKKFDRKDLDDEAA
jgi:hypothetical protein